MSGQVARAGDVVRVVTKLEIRFDADVHVDTELVEVEKIVGEWRSEVQEDLRKQLIGFGMKRVIVNVQPGE